MSVRVAIASTDGKVINEHFGRATRFHIFSLEEKEYHFVESRTVEPCCHGGEHEENAFDKVAQLLKDCAAIIVAKIGDGASNYLENKGFEVFEAPYFITDVLQKIIDDQLLEGGDAYEHII